MYYYTSMIFIDISDTDHRLTCMNIDNITNTLCYLLLVGI